MYVRACYEVLGWLVGCDGLVMNPQTIYKQSPFQATQYSLTIDFPQDHWRKNLPVLGQKYRTYSIDLLGYGFSDKPDPRSRETNELYCFETWARQIEGAWVGSWWACRVV